MERKLNVGERLLWTEGRHSWAIAVGMTLQGETTVEEFQVAIRKTRQKHTLMGVRIALDKRKDPWFVSEGVPDCPIRIVNRQSDGGHKLL